MAKRHTQTAASGQWPRSPERDMCGSQFNAPTTNSTTTCTWLQATADWSAPRNRTHRLLGHSVTHHTLYCSIQVVHSFIHFNYMKSKLIQVCLHCHSLNSTFILHPVTSPSPTNCRLQHRDALHISSKCHVASLAKRRLV